MGDKPDFWIFGGGTGKKRVILKGGSNYVETMEQKLRSPNKLVVYVLQHVW